MLIITNFSKLQFCLQCFDTTGWVSGTASGSGKNTKFWCGYLSGARCKWSACGPADTSTPSYLASL